MKNGRRATLFHAGVLAGVGLAGAARPAWAQESDRARILGTWSLVEMTLQQGGNRIEPFGPAPRGLMVMTADGYFTTNLMRASLPKFASNNRMTGTAEENQAAVRGVLSFFGTYRMDEAAKIVHLRIVGSSYPNWDGTDQPRGYSFEGDTLIYDSPAGTSGPGVPRIVWRRAG